MDTHFVASVGSTVYIAIISRRIAVFGLCKVLGCVRCVGDTPLNPKSAYPASNRISMADHFPTPSTNA